MTRIIAAREPQASAAFAGRLVEALVAGAGSDGGWGAAAGLPANTEATSLALLVTRGAGPVYGDAAAGAVQWLTERQRPDGSWAYTQDVPQSSWSSSLATLALGKTGNEEVARRGVEWLIGQEGRGFPFRMWLRYRLFPEDQAIVLNPSFRGWPWAPDTFGWVEPTAWAMIALRSLAPIASRRRTADRLRDGERMILDRMCDGGGWNYGNSVVLGEELEPFPDTTALALMALHHLEKNEAIRQSLERLEGMLQSNDSGLTLALAILCYRLYGKDSSPLAARLEQRFEATGFLGETRTLALAALALADTHPFGAAHHA